jgi:hypothetical protein
MYKRGVLLHRGRVGDFGRFVLFGGGGFVFGRVDGIVAVGCRLVGASVWFIRRGRYHDRRLLHL